MRNRMYYLRRAAAAVILLGVVLYHSAGLMRLLERALSAPPRQQAAGIISLTVTVLLFRILWNGLATVVVGDRGASTAHTVVPMGVARLAHPGAVARSDLERWAEIHKNEGESTKDAVKRLEPLWDQRELGEDISIKQRRRHEAAHAVITYVLGGTLMSTPNLIQATVVAGTGKPRAPRRNDAGGRGHDPAGDGVTVIDLHPQRRRLITTPDKPDDETEGQRRRLTSRHVVRGHWTHQPHGPQRALRRLQWIDDYIRGPQDAPLTTRTHVWAWRHQ